MQLLAAAYSRVQSDTEVQVLQAIGSSGGIGAVLGGKLDIGLANRLPNAAESARGALQSLEYARTPFVVAAHANLGVRALTMEQLAALFEAGATWPGGQRARPVMRSNDATDTTILKSLSPAVAGAVDQALARRGMLDADTDSATADLIQNTPGAFGPSTLALILTEGRPLVALTLGGADPSAANVAAGRYPWHKRLYAVTAQAPTDAVRRFADYLRSADALRLLRQYGHLAP
jgi:phosphate transport system substrate-binding protein